MASYLVTGAGRGLGFELVSQLSRKPSSEVSVIFAATRSEPSTALQALIDSSDGRVVNVLMVLTDKSSIDSGVKQVEQKLAGRGLDVLINNAGIMQGSPDGIHTMSNLREAFQVNVEAVHDVTAAFLPLLRKGEQKKVLNVNTTLGSISYSNRYTWAPQPAYKISKAALTMLTVQYAIEFEKEGFAFFSVTPGWLKTDMGSQQADLDVDVGAKSVLEIASRDGKALNGKFLNIHAPGWERTDGPNQYDGAEVPW